MKLSTIAALTNASVCYKTGELALESDYTIAFSADLMSDALALFHHVQNGILITGLMNAQTLRTAEMLDIQAILFVRGKCPTAVELELAKELNLTLLSTRKSMYESCGILYNAGLAGMPLG